MKKIFIIALAVFPIWVSAAVFERDLSYGIRDNPEVTRLQQFLHDQGLYSGPINGNFFALTREAVKRFQEREGIAPMAGYFGSKSRARAEVLFASSPPPAQSQIELLRTQIALLQARLAELIRNKETTPSPTPSPSSSVSPSPSSSSSPSPTPSSSPTPSPSPSPAPSPSPKPALEIKGDHTQAFPDATVSPLKLGDITISNGTTTNILVNQFELDIYDSMNSPLNRGKTVLFKVRNGTSTFDPLISETSFQFNIDGPNPTTRRQVKIPLGITSAAGQEKVISLWIEGFDYVISGTLRIEMLSVLLSDSVIPQGGFRFLLTK